jgi:membrane-associated phospholipid phosphatase
MEKKRLFLAGLEIRLTDAVVLGGLVFLTLLALAFNGRLAHPTALIGTNLLFIVLYIGSLTVLRHLRPKLLRFLLRTASVQFTYLQVFLTSRDLQLLFFSWNDDRVLGWEKVRVLLTEPLRGGVFSSAAEYIRAHIHGDGGSIPSPHCAVATVMWFMSLKYTRRGFWLLAPVILSLYVSTVYGRFLYLSDMVIGIAAAVFVLLAAPSIAGAWNRWTDKRTGGAA